MNTGMMWFDNDPKTTLDVKIQQAADYYRQKYGRTPDMCLVNPGVLDKAGSGDPRLTAGKILIRPFRSVLPGHLWIGVEDPAPIPPPFPQMQEQHLGEERSCRNKSSSRL